MLARVEVGYQQPVVGETAGRGSQHGELVPDVLVELLAARENVSTGTRSQVMRRAEQLVAQRFGEGAVAMPSRARQPAASGSSGPYQRP